MIQSEASPPLRRRQIDVSRSTTGVFPTVHCRGGATQLQPFIKKQTVNGGSVRILRQTRYTTVVVFFFIYSFFQKTDSRWLYVAPSLDAPPLLCLSGCWEVNGGMQRRNHRHNSRKPRRLWAERRPGTAAISPSEQQANRPSLPPHPSNLEAERGPRLVITASTAQRCLPSV